MSFKLTYFNDVKTEQFIGSKVESKIFLIFTASHMFKQESEQFEEIVSDLKKTNDPAENSILEILKLFMLDPLDFLVEFNKTAITVESLTLYVAYMALHKNINDIDIKKSSKILNFVLPVSLNRVRLGKSNIHGNGVFATKVLEEGDIATFYPVHVVFTYDENTNNKNTCNYYNFTYRDDVNRINFLEYEPYIYCINKTCCIAGYPMICSNPDLIGHIINDGSNSKYRNIYDSENNNIRNCKFFNIVDIDSTCYVIAIVATKRIEIGEELFLRYGFKYWENK